MTVLNSPVFFSSSMTSKFLVLALYLRLLGASRFFVSCRVHTVPPVETVDIVYSKVCTSVHRARGDNVHNVECRVVHHTEVIAALVVSVVGGCASFGLREVNVF